LLKTFFKISSSSASPFLFKSLLFLAIITALEDALIMHWLVFHQWAGYSSPADLHSEKKVQFETQYLQYQITAVR
jgi:hypothetical protein